MQKWEDGKARCRKVQKKSRRHKEKMFRREKCDQEAAAEEIKENKGRKNRHVKWSFRANLVGVDLEWDTKSNE